LRGGMGTEHLAIEQIIERLPVAGSKARNRGSSLAGQWR
jgi:hypothetical protein